MERYAKEQGIFRTNQTPDPEFTDVLELDLATVEPSLAGPKRPAGPRPTVANEAGVSPRAFRSRKGARFRAVRRRRGPQRQREVQRRKRPVESRGGGDRGDHILHQHFQSLRDVGGGVGSKESAGKRIASSALRKNQSRARLESSDGIFAGRRIARIARRPALQPGGLWLHHLHRQQRPPTAGGGKRRDRGPIGGRRGSFRQSQF